MENQNQFIPVDDPNFRPPPHIPDPLYGLLGQPIKTEKTLNSRERLFIETALLNHLERCIDEVMSDTLTHEDVTNIMNHINAYRSILEKLK